jgi:ferrous iron transport protein A
MSATTTTLDQLAPGQSARVQRINGEGAVRRRLLDMGITSGVEIAVVKASPLGDPVEYLVRGYHLSLRKAEAQMITVVREP